MTLHSVRAWVLYVLQLINAVMFGAALANNWLVQASLHVLVVLLAAGVLASDWSARARNNPDGQP